MERPHWRRPLQASRHHRQPPACHCTCTTPAHFLNLRLLSMLHGSCDCNLHMPPCADMPTIAAAGCSRRRRAATWMSSPS